MAQSSDFQTETDNESISLRHLSADYDYDAAIDSGKVFRAVAECKERYSGVAKLGLEVLELKSIGYTSREIAQRYGTTGMPGFRGRGRSSCRTLLFRESSSKLLLLRRMLRIRE